MLGRLQEIFKIYKPMIRTSKDANFTEVDFGDICEIKKIIIQIFENYKQYWVSGGCERWDYKVMEYDNDTPGIYEVRILCGVHSNTIIMKESSHIESKDFAEQSYARKRVWNRVLINIGTAGAVKIYQDSVQLFRDMTGDYSKYPLTITEF